MKLKFDNKSSLREKIQFKWVDSSAPYLKRVRKEFKLDEIIKDAKDDLEKIEEVNFWVHSLWEHDGSNTPTKTDSISMVNEAKQKGKGFQCINYSTVLNDCLNSIGITSRMLKLITEDIETKKSCSCHWVVESYIKKFGKWAFIDPQTDVLPIIDGKPINAVEFQKAIEEKKNITKNYFLKPSSSNR